MEIVHSPVMGRGPVHVRHNHLSFSFTDCCICSLFTGFVTFFLLGTNPTPSPDTSAPHRGTQLEMWATFLGLLSALLAAMQYAPQIVHTYRLKLVGALSIKMMLIQSPGSLLMVLSIALR